MPQNNWVLHYRGRNKFSSKFSADTIQESKFERLEDLHEDLQNICPSQEIHRSSLMISYIATTREMICPRAAYTNKCQFLV